MKNNKLKNPTQDQLYSLCATLDSSMEMLLKLSKQGCIIKVPDDAMSLPEFVDMLDEYIPKVLLVLDTMGFKSEWATLHIHQVPQNSLTGNL